MPSYCTGISQPANGTSFAPAATWASKRGVRLSVPASTLATILTAVTLTDDEMIDRAGHLYELLNAGNFDDAMKMVHPEGVLVRAGGQGQLQGPDALRNWLEPDAFASQVYEALEFEARGDRLLVKLHIHARGSGSGIEIEIYGWTVYTFDADGLLTRAEVFLEHEEDAARRALNQTGCA